MKVNKTFSIDYQFAERLQQEENASTIVNNLLAQHYSINSKNELEVLRNVHEKMTRQASEEKETEDRDKIAKWIKDNMGTEEGREEYLEGIKEGKWKGVIEYEKQKIFDERLHNEK